MAELEIHHEVGHEADPTGRTVGILAAVLAVFLAIVTIASHRTHTAAIIHKSTANDEWSHYQATRVKYHNLELGENLLAVLGGKGTAADKMLADYAAQKKDYAQRAADIQKKAEGFDAQAEHDEDRAFRYDVGEGLLEIGVVLSSLYFISKRKMFPVMGLIAGLSGALIAASALIV
ncbi:MAG TPA: DUF4337 domain-containing protein [Candidatus Sulfopaludibacter sp.]|jgi:hypothetical protein|nr:DUF4337 domain-containing protein [Candidatus Sulfopaludibacter sp.]